MFVLGRLSRLHFQSLLRLQAAELNVAMRAAGLYRFKELYRRIVGSQHTTLPFTTAAAFHV
jgi:hypothetical protein